MPNECRYFSSNEWLQRRNAFLDVVPTTTLFEGFVGTSNVDELRSEIRDALDLADGEVLDDVPFRRLFENVGEHLPSTDYEEWWDRWREKRHVEYPEQCPHPVKADGLCAFHLRCDHESKPDDSRTALLDAVADGRYTFTGAKFPSLDLRYAELAGPENRPIDLRHISVDGRIELASAVLSRDVTMIGSDVAGIGMDRCRIEGSFNASYSNLGRCDAELAAFLGGPTRFRRCRFEDGVDLTSARFAQVADFRGSRFDSTVRFWKCRFDDRARFESAEFDASPVVFRRSRFDGPRANFSKAVVDGNLDLGRCRVSGELFLSELTTTGDVSISGGRIGDDVEARGVDIEGRLGALDAEFDGDVSLSEGCCSAAIRFDNAEVRGAITFRHTNASRVSFEGASVAAGVIVQPENGETDYSFEDAVVGAVRLDDDPAAGSTTDFDRYRFLNTTFDGFEFDRYVDELSDNWRIHTHYQKDGTVDESPSLFRRLLRSDPSEDPTEDLISTYLKAKNGAEAVGESRAGSQFFLKEMRYRRRHHRERMRNGPLCARVGGAADWFSNLAYDISIGYGERPGRTVIFSMIVILAYTAVYQTLEVRSGILENTVLSSQAFVTLVLGGIPDDGRLVVQIAAASEAFLGAFFIALFVFALTRSVHR